MHGIKSGYTFTAITSAVTRQAVIVLIVSVLFAILGGCAQPVEYEDSEYIDFAEAVAPYVAKYGPYDNDYIFNSNHFVFWHDDCIQLCFEEEEFDGVHGWRLANHSNYYGDYYATPKIALDHGYQELFDDRAAGAWTWINNSKDNTYTIDASQSTATVEVAGVDYIQGVYQVDYMYTYSDKIKIEVVNQNGTTLETFKLLDYDGDGILNGDEPLDGVTTNVPYDYNNNNRADYVEDDYTELVDAVSEGEAVFYTDYLYCNPWDTNKGWK